MGIHDDDEEAAFEKTNIFSNVTQKIHLEDDVQLPPCLVLLVGPADQMGRQWVLNEHTFTIGRNPTSSIHINEVSLSKAHARIDLSQGKATITDLGSTNKTIVDGKPLEPQKPETLKNNVHIRAGSLVFKYLEQGILSETTEKQRMQSELEKARQLQESLFPEETEKKYDWLNLAGQYRSASEIGGDWWWHWKCGHRAFAIVGDATGHGASAGLITSAARSAIATIEDNLTLKIENVYKVLSNAIQRCSGNRMAMSAFIVEIDLLSRELRYVNASHLAAIALPRAGQMPTWREINVINEPVSSAVGATDPKLLVGSVKLPADYRLLLYTDGLAERNDASGTQINERTLNTMILQAHTGQLTSPSGFLRDLFQLSDQNAKSAQLQDDITAVVIDF